MEDWMLALAAAAAAAAEKPEAATSQRLSSWRIAREVKQHEHLRKPDRGNS